VSERHARLRRALLGLSVGDAFGERFFGLQGETILQRAEAREVPPPLWPVTDDTMLALGIAQELNAHGTIQTQRLLERFAALYAWDPRRGYGGGMHELFGAMARGGDGATVAAAMFGGTGSMGNGSAMRVAPLGAFFADDLGRCAEEARRSALATHRHTEGIAGAIATAIAAASLWRNRDVTDIAAAVFEDVLAACPAGRVRDGLSAAAALERSEGWWVAATRLGTGGRILAEDTVPFCVWMATKHPRDFETALWETVSGMGDRDTTCAIVGGLIANTAPQIPAGWSAAREGPAELSALSA